jgi:dihydropyrimidinase
LSRTIISGGTIVNSTGAHGADVLIEDEKIVALLLPGNDLHRAMLDSAVKRIDATGKYVIPGGVDAHTHMEMPFGGTQASDTFETGTRAAAWGGTTTIIDFVVQRAGEHPIEKYHEWQDRAAGRCAIDYGFHQILSDVDTESLKAMDELVNEGVTSFKFFMAYKGVFLSDDGQIFRGMQRAANNGALIMMHAENGSVIDVLVEQAIASGNTAPLHHGLTRPWQAEEEATHRAIMLADISGAPLYIVHVSAKQAVEQIAAARDAGKNVFAETCPQYLYLSLEEQLGAPGFDGAKWVCSTPLRSRAEGHQEYMWQGLRTNDLQVVSTDHCPFCMKGQKELGVDDFSKIPNGMGTVEHRLDLLYQGVVSKRISLPRWVELCSTMPALMFGLYGRKGVIQPGADADVVIYDPNGHTTIGRSTHHMNIDYSAWEGFEIDGHVDLVMSRGKIVIDNDRYTGKPGHGKYFKRGLSQCLV